MPKIFKSLYNFGDKLEDKVRGFLSHFPIAYALIGAIGIVIFWRGVWHTVDYLMLSISAWHAGTSTIDINSGAWWDGPLSFVVGSLLLLMTGVFVSNFIGNEILISGLKKEKKLAEKTEEEVRTEEERIASVRNQVALISSQMSGLKAELDQIMTISQSGKSAEAKK